MSSEAKRQAARWMALALLLGAWASPTPPVAIALLAVWLGLRSAGPIGRRWRRARRAGALRRASLAAAGNPTVIGTDRDGHPVRLSDRQLAAHALIVGASGAGKSTTLLTLLEARVARGDPVVAIDLKGSPGFAETLRAQARRADRQLAVFTPDGDRHWNPLAHGNPTALKDMLISTERFTEPHYQRAAERYLQSALQVLDASHPGVPPTLGELVRVMEPRRLAGLLEGVPEGLRERVGDYLDGLGRDSLSAIRGLGTRLALLSESSAGQWLEPDTPQTTIDLRRAMEGGDVVLFSLNSSVYGKLAAQLGALAVQDLVSATGDRLTRGGAQRPAMVALDEFSALEADNVLALLARGREAGMSVVLATQELADLERAGRGFSEQTLGIIGVKIAHRQDLPQSARLFAQMAGTHEVWERTETLRSPLASSSAVRGSRRRVERFLVHPNEIMSLPPGHAVILAKLPETRIMRVRVRAPDRGQGPERDRPSGAAPGPASGPKGGDRPPSGPTHGGRLPSGPTRGGHPPSARAQHGPPAAQVQNGRPPSAPAAELPLPPTTPRAPRPRRSTPPRWSRRRGRGEDRAEPEQGR